MPRPLPLPRLPSLRTRPSTSAVAGALSLVVFVAVGAVLAAAFFRSRRAATAEEDLTAAVTAFGGAVGARDYDRARALLDDATTPDHVLERWRRTLMLGKPDATRGSDVAMLGDAEPREGCARIAPAGTNVFLHLVRRGGGWRIADVGRAPAGGCAITAGSLS